MSVVKQRVKEAEGHQIRLRVGDQLALLSWYQHCEITLISYIHFDINSDQTHSSRRGSKQRSLCFDFNDLRWERSEHFLLPETSEDNTMTGTSKGRCGFSWKSRSKTKMSFITLTFQICRLLSQHWSQLASAALCCLGRGTQSHSSL